jgi:hypothetical protein
MALRLVMLALFIIAIFVFKGHGSAYVGFRVAYFALLVVLIVMRFGFMRRRGTRDPYMPHQSTTTPTSYHQPPTAATSTVPTPSSEPPPAGSSGLTWGGLPPEIAPPSPPAP